jgi:boron transporter
MHTESLVVMGFPPKKNDSEESAPPSPNPYATPTTGEPLLKLERPVAVVEQRVSNLVQGSICLVLMTGPFLRLLHWVPKGVLVCSPRQYLR